MKFEEVEKKCLRMPLELGYVTMKNYAEQASVKLAERKTVHEWLNQLGTPTHEETGKPMCLLRRLAVQLGMAPWKVESDAPSVPAGTPPVDSANGALSSEGGADE